MRGDSLVRTTYVLDAKAQQLLEEPRVPDQVQQDRECLGMMRTLTDLTETIRSGMPLPPKAGNEPEEHDQLVVEVVRQVYGMDPVTASDLAVNPEPALRDGRLRQTGDYVHVPLEDTDRASRNWWLVFQFVRRRLNEIEQKTRRLLDRAHQSDRVPDGDCWHSVLRMIGKLQDLVFVALTRQSWFRHHAAYDEQLVESITNVAGLLGVEPEPRSTHVQT